MSARVRYLRGRVLGAEEPCREGTACTEGEETLAEVIQAAEMARARQRWDEMRFSFIMLAWCLAGMTALALLARWFGGGQ